MHFIRQFGMDELFHQLLMPIRRVFTEVEMNGFYVDVEAAKELERRCEIAKEQLLKQAYEAAGQEFNINSPKQKQELFFKKFGEKPTVFSKKTKNPSCNAEVIEEIAENGKHPKARIVAQSLSDVTYIGHQQNLPYSSAYTLREETHILQQTDTSMNNPSNHT